MQDSHDYPTLEEEISFLKLYWQLSDEDKKTIRRMIAELQDSTPQEEDSE